MRSLTLLSDGLPNAVPPSHTRAVLVVDPDADTRQLYRQCFELAQCTVIEASDGRDALTKALEYRPSLVVTEMRLDFIDGVALCELLRLDPATSGVPILVITGESRSAVVEQARRAGADAVLSKPTLPDSMLEIATTLIHRSTRLQGHLTPIREHTAGQTGRSGMVIRRSDEGRRTTRSQSHARFVTVNPPAAPPQLMCPSCDGSLTYDHSHVGGVSDRHPEQWDYYVCSKCGTFQYRQRTRKLRRVH